MKNHPLYFQNTEFCLAITNLIEIKVIGSDAKSFLNGQITTNLDLILPDTFISFARLDPKGRIKFSGYIIFRDNNYSLIISESEKEKILNDLKMYIISEDVELFELQISNSYFLGNAISGEQNYSGIMNTIPGFLILNSKLKPNISGIENFQIFNLLLSSHDGIFPESILSLNSFHQEKGCFVGQEIVSKIENNRGARLFPLIIETNDFDEFENNDQIFCDSKEFGKIVGKIKYNQMNFALVKAMREFHLEQNEVTLKINSIEFQSNIFLIKDFIDQQNKSLSNDFFILGVDFLNAGKTELAENYFTLSLQLNNQNKDSLESIGVLYGRKKQFKLAHEMMDRLLKIDPASIMAHTNKSLFFMNEGKISEAEHEKELALKIVIPTTQKSTEINMNEIQLEKIAKLKKQLSMYEEVLEIDPEDDFAINKWLEINFDLGNFKEILKFLEIKDVYHSVKYFVWMHKAYDSLGEDLTFMSKDCSKMLKLALKNGDMKSVEYLKKLCK